MFGNAVVDDDIRRIVEARPDVFRALDGRRVLITGGTGFVGVWLLRALLGAGMLLGVRSEIVVLSRDPGRFRARRPELFDPQGGIALVAGDVRDPISVGGPLDIIVHAAAETNVALDHPPPVRYLDVGLRGVLRVADAAIAAPARRILLISSGAVYGKGAFAGGAAREDAPEAPPATDARAAYANAKRASEAHLAALAASGGPEVTIARIFAAVGPDLPLDSGYAVGNFVRDAVAGGPIVVRGDGTAVRSYLYASDLALWLWTIGVHGASGRAYNVGSEIGVSIGEVAAAVSAASGGVSISVEGSPITGVRPEYYVPSTARARDELGLKEVLPLAGAVARTLEWARMP